jgi:segregation and condensation protein B
MSVEDLEQVASEQGEVNTQSEQTDAADLEAARPKLSEPELVALLEALLFANGEPLSIARIQELLGMAKGEVLGLADKLAQSLNQSERGIELVVVAEKLQLRTRAKFADYVRQLMAVRPRKLSQAALETLAVVAYQQPVVKSEIDKIRGVDVAPTIKTLLERKLVKIIGYQASVGQPALYGTTEEFLQVFGLPALSALPSIQDLKALVREPGEAQVEQDESAEQLNSEGDEDATSAEVECAPTQDGAAQGA